MVISALPLEFATKLDNTNVKAQDWPTPDQLRRTGLRHGQSLLSLCEGIPMTKRGQQYRLVPPDKIAIFWKPNESRCRDDSEITAEIQRVGEA